MHTYGYEGINRGAKETEMKMKKSIVIAAALLAALCSIPNTQAAITTAGELIVDLNNADLDASTNVWVNNATSTNSVGDFQRLDTNNITVLPSLADTNGIIANGLQVDQVLVNALRSASPTPSLVETNNTRSVEVWVYTIGLDSGASCTVGWGSAGNDQMSSFNYYNHSGNGMFSAWNNDSGWGAATLLSGEWTYLVYTYDGTTVSGYINGDFANSYTTGDSNGSGYNLDTTHNYLGIGAARDAGADPFVGRIGDVRVHTGVLSLSDIANNYAEGMAVPADLSPTVTGLEDASVFEGQDLTLEATVSGALPITYQWSSNSVAIAGATNTTLSLTNLQLSADGAVFSIEVNNAHGSDSDSMTLAVETITVLPPVTINLDINKDSNNQYSGSAIAPGSGTVWNQFNNCSGTAIPHTMSGVVDSHGNVLDTCQINWTSSTKTAFKAYRDTSSGNPNPVDLMSDYTYQGPYTAEITSLPEGEYDLYVYAHNNNSGPSTITVATTNGGMIASTSDYGDYRDIYQTNAYGNSYLVMTGVVATAGGSFSFTISDYLEGFQLQNALPVIEAMTDLTVVAGTNLVINPGVAGRSPSCQWSYNGSPMAGETNATLTLDDVQIAQGGEYSLAINNSLGSDSGSMILTVESGAIGPITIDSISVAGGLASLTWTADAGAGYDIESASNLVSSNWVAVATNVTSAGSQTTDVPVSGDDEEFYRISK